MDKYENIYSAYVCGLLQEFRTRTGYKELGYYEGEVVDVSGIKLFRIAGENIATHQLKTLNLASSIYRLAPEFFGYPSEQTNARRIIVLEFIATQGIAKASAEDPVKDGREIEESRINTALDGYKRYVGMAYDPETAKELIRLYSDVENSSTDEAKAIKALGMLENTLMVGVLQDFGIKKKITARPTNSYIDNIIERIGTDNTYDVFCEQLNDYVGECSVAMRTTVAGILKASEYKTVNYDLIR